jgi:molybdenum cofactor cytidylyltransferase
MGSPKALLTIGKKTFICHIKDNLLDAGVKPVLIILGYEADTIQKHISSERVVILINPDYTKGQVTSIQCGVRYLENHPSAGALVCPVDTPLFSSKLVQKIVGKGENGEKGIIIPTFDGRRGHPAFFAKRFFKEILNAPLDQGARWVIRQHPEDVQEIPTEEAGILQNINTPEDYKHYIGPD